MIYYGRGFESRFKGSGRNWEGYMVVAHEMAHLAWRHTLDKDHTLEYWELWADRFAGCAVGMPTDKAKVDTDYGTGLGGTLEDALKPYQSFPVNAENGHPSRAKRIEYVTQGWNIGHNDTGDTSTRYSQRCWDGANLPKVIP